nr:FecR family protein [Sunxiuqinia sp.]
MSSIEEINAETERLFLGAKVEWGENKELIWENNFDRLFQEKKGKTVDFKNRIVKLSFAASFLILVGIGSFGWFYNNMYVAPKGEHLSATLPDGSIVELNAASTLKVYPFRWQVVRSVQFEGEGFFEVQKGKKFTVNSKYGKTSVLGTSFNIFSRDDTYRVLCVTGKVNVSGTKDAPVILNPNEQVILKSGKILNQLENISPENITSWRFNQFIYTAAPFGEVIKEIERQYGISISSNKTLDRTISVSFQKDPDVEKVLSMVCKPLGYTYVKKSESNYLITGDN